MGIQLLWYTKALLYGSSFEGHQDLFEDANKAVVYIAVITHCPRINFVCSSQYMHGARSTVLYCAHLAIFMQYNGVFRTIVGLATLTHQFPYI